MDALLKEISLSIASEEYKRREHSKYVLMDFKTYEKLELKARQTLNFPIGMAIRGVKVIRSEDIKGWEVVF